MIKCPTCGKTDCIRMADEVLDSIYQIYLACPLCPPEPGWDKKVSLSALSGGRDFHHKTLLCGSCGRRPLDAVMGNALSIMLEHGDRNDNNGLADAGTPLIVRGFPLVYPPRLGPDSIVLIADHIRLQTAEDIVNRVPEVRGVVLRVGDQSKSVGILDIDSKPHEYQLLAGCDMRCDLAQTTFGELVIYKNQSRMHIEFDNRSKMEVLEHLEMKNMLAGKVVVDGMCGPGTLGLMALAAGASKVIFIDAWRPAIENVLLNFEVNRDILDVEPEPMLSVDGMPEVVDEPVMVAAAGRGEKTVAEVYLGDLRRLVDKVDGCDVCLIDTFPSANPSEFVRIWTRRTPDVIVV